MQAIWNFLTEHYGVVSALASLSTLGVWVLYLQLFYSSYRHQLEPKILITRGGGHSFKSRCMLSNMSPESVFIQAILIRLVTDETELTCSLSEIDRGSSEKRDPRSEFFQGPLSSGEYLELGSFEELVLAATCNCDGEAALGDVKEFTVTAVGTYPWHDRMAAAERSFTLCRHNDRTLLQADRHTARQIRSRRELKRIGRLLEQQSSRSAYHKGAACKA